MKLPGIDEYEFFWTQANGAVIVRTKTQKALEPISKAGKSRRYILYLGHSRRKVELTESKIVAAMTYGVDPTSFSMPKGRPASAAEVSSEKRSEALSDALEMQRLTKAIYEGLLMDKWGIFLKMAEDARSKALVYAGHQNGCTKGRMSAIYDEAIELLIDKLKAGKVTSYRPLWRWLGSECIRLYKLYKVSDAEQRTVDNRTAVIDEYDI